MPYFCKSIEYLYAEGATLLDGEIVPKSGYEFKDIASKVKLVVEERPRKEKGNLIYEQTVALTYKYYDIVELQELSDRYLIVKVNGLNTVPFVIGSIDNPAQVEISIKNSFADILFSRLSLMPQSPGLNLAKSYVSESYQPPQNIAELEARTSQFYATANQTSVVLGITPDSIISILLESEPYLDYTVTGNTINFLIPIPEYTQVTINYLIKV